MHNSSDGILFLKLNIPTWNKYWWLSFRSYLLDPTLRSKSHSFFFWLIPCSYRDWCFKVIINFETGRTDEAYLIAIWFLSIKLLNKNIQNCNIAICCAWSIIKNTWHQIEFLFETMISWTSVTHSQESLCYEPLYVSYDLSICVCVESL